MLFIGKHAIVVFVLGVVASIVVTWTIASRDFYQSRTNIIRTVEHLDGVHSVLPALVTNVDEIRLQQQLRPSAQHDAVAYAIVYNGANDILAAQYNNGYSEESLAPPDMVRAGRQPLERVITERDAPPRDARDDAWYAKLFPAFFGTRVSDVSIPIISPINPLEEPVTPESLINYWNTNATMRSYFVVGSLTFGIEHATIWQGVSYNVALTILYCLVALSMATAISGYYGRHLLGSLIELAEFAREAASKEIDTDIKFQARGEAQHIAALLNTAFAELKRYRAHVNVDRELLNLKVEAQGSLLTERSQQLDEARTEVSRTREDLHRMAYYDSLTGLPNRRLFNEQLNLLLRMAGRENCSLALMFIDLDNFKRINDSLGHSAGDLLLREVSIRLANCTRTSDLLGHFMESHINVEVSRLGGDEFTIVANNLKDPSEASIVAERTLKALAAPMTIDSHELIVTPSIGIAIGPRDGKDVESLVRAADTAMYKAKESGKNNYVFYSDTMKTSNVTRLQLETDLRKAIERDELLLHYQPMVSMKTGTVIGVEALVRWQHPDRGLVSPGEFIPVAEELGLTLDIGEWTFQEACRTAVALKNEGINLRKISVNISPLAVSRSFIDRVKHIIKATGADASSIELELTENVLMETDASSIESLQQLKELGVALSIDDFGTGYSSLSYLSHFPLDTLKIDRSFVQDFDKSRANESLVEAITAMAFSLHLNVVAEGVETPQQLKFLRGLKVDVIQGYLFSKPVTREQLPYILGEGHFKQKVNHAALAEMTSMTMDPA